MTEVEWFACAEPRQMLLQVPETVSTRKLALFRCWCCRPLLGTEPVLGGEAAQMFAAAEAFAEGDVTLNQLGEFFPRYCPDLYPTYPHDRPELFWELDARGSVTYLAFKSLGPPQPDHGWDLDPTTYEHIPRPWEPGERDKEMTDRVCIYAVQALAMLAVDYKWSPEGLPPAYHAREQEVRTAFAVTFREIFGNPFRPAAFSPAWRTDAVIALAARMYETRDFNAMPVLADALQDAGCDSEDVLNHCRGPQRAHVRGCWVTDLVLGKT